MSLNWRPPRPEYNRTPALPAAQLAAVERPAACGFFALAFASPPSRTLTSRGEADDDPRGPAFGGGDGLGPIDLTNSVLVLVNSSGRHRRVPDGLMGTLTVSAPVVAIDQEKAPHGAALFRRSSPLRDG